MAEGRQALRERMEYNLTNHPPKLDITKMRMEKVRADALNLAYSIIDNCPESQEQSLALTKLEETVMQAIAAIARHEQEV